MQMKSLVPLRRHGDQSLGSRRHLVRLGRGDNQAQSIEATPVTVGPALGHEPRQTRERVRNIVALYDVNKKTAPNVDTPPEPAETERDIALGGDVVEDRVRAGTPQGVTNEPL